MNETLLLPTSPLSRFADSILRQEALTCRIGEGRPPKDFAGMYVDHADVDRILGSLPGLDGPDPDHVDAEIAHIRAEVATARFEFRSWLQGNDLYPSIVRFAGLSAEDAELLAVVVAVSADLRRQQLVGYIQDSVQLNRCSIWLLRRLFPRPHAGPGSLFSPGHLWRSGLAVVEDQPAFARRLATPADALVASLSESSDDPLPVPDGVELIGTAAPERGLLLVPGSDRVDRLSVAAQRGGFVVSSEVDGPDRLAEVVAFATVAKRGVMLDPVESMSTELRDWIRRASHLPWILGSRTELPLDEIPVSTWLESPAPQRRVVGADGWSLTSTQDRLAAQAETAFAGERRRAVRRLAGGHLDSLATRIVPSRDWSDLVLPHEEMAQLAELAGRYRQRFKVYEDWGFRAVPSSGLVALFAGPSGTGKTLAAEVVAGELALDVFKIDLSSVVSKYIGETEKNISRVFQAAEAGRVLLFFDEADALFGKRSEVGDAHDRYANIEVSYLLQRLEAHEGIVVLATNFAKNIDQAFLRRIHVSVEFPLPEEEARLDIWRRSFPEGAPTRSLDLPFLAKQFRLTGGSIRNAALAGAFLAADAGVSISMDQVILGVKREFQKLGRLRTKEEFGRYFEVIEGAGATNGETDAEFAR